MGRSPKGLKSVASGQEPGGPHFHCSEVFYFLTPLLVFHSHMSLKALSEKEKKKKRKRNASDPNE